MIAISTILLIGRGLVDAYLNHKVKQHQNQHVENIKQAITQVPDNASLLEKAPSLSTPLNPSKPVNLVGGICWAIAVFAEIALLQYFGGALLFAGVAMQAGMLHLMSKDTLQYLQLQLEQTLLRGELDEAVTLLRITYTLKITTSKLLDNAQLKQELIQQALLTCQQLNPKQLVRFREKLTAFNPG